MTTKKIDELPVSQLTTQEALSAFLPISGTGSGGDELQRINFATLKAMLLDNRAVEPHEYWRVIFDANNSTAFCGLSELQFFKAGSITNAVALHPGTPLASGGTPAFAFDNGASNTGWNDAGTSGAWIGYHFSKAVGIARVRLTAAQFTDQSPKDFRVQFSDNGTDWTTAWTVTAQTNWFNGEVRQYVDPDPIWVAAEGEVAEPNKRLWAFYDGTNGIKRAGNGLSIVKNGAGNYRVVFDIPRQDTNYAVIMGGADMGYQYGSIPVIAYNTKSVDGFSINSFSQQTLAFYDVFMSLEVIDGSVDTMGGFTDAPIDGRTYVRKNGKWIEATVGGGGGSGGIGDEAPLDGKGYVRRLAEWSAPRLSDDIDVDFSIAPFTGQSLVYDASSQKWKPGTPSGARKAKVVKSAHSGDPSLATMTSPPKAGNLLIAVMAAQDYYPAPAAGWTSGANAIDGGGRVHGAVVYRVVDTVQAATPEIRPISQGYSYGALSVYEIDCEGRSPADVIKRIDLFMETAASPYQVIDDSLVLMVAVSRPDGSTVTMATGWTTDGFGDGDNRNSFAFHKNVTAGTVVAPGITITGSENYFSAYIYLDNAENTIPEAPTDGGSYARKDSTWVKSVNEAPTDGRQYARKNGDWIEVVATEDTGGGNGGTVGGGGPGTGSFGGGILAISGTSNKVTHVSSAPNYAPINSMSTTFDLPVASRVVVDFSITIYRATGAIHLLMYVDGIRVAPDSAVNWNTIKNAEIPAQQVFTAGVPLTLAPGEHTVELWYSDAESTGPFDALNRFVRVSMVSSNTPATISNYESWSVAAIGTGASQAIELPGAVDKEGVLVFVNGLRFPTVDYTIEGTALTLTTNQVGDAIEVVGSSIASVNRLVTVSLLSNGFTLGLADAGGYKRILSANTTTVTVPTNAVVPFPIGTQVSIVQAGAGQVTVAPASGVVVNSPETTKLRKRFSGATLTKVAVDEWDMIGDIHGGIVDHSSWQQRSFDPAGSHDTVNAVGTGIHQRCRVYHASCQNVGRCIVRWAVWGR
jgi:hypothetical protein